MYVSLHGSYSLGVFGLTDTTLNSQYILKYYTCEYFFKFLSLHILTGFFEGEKLSSCFAVVTVGAAHYSAHLTQHYTIDYTQNMSV